jgi:hypothetical protein
MRPEHQESCSKKNKLKRDDHREFDAAHLGGPFGPGNDGDLKRDPRQGDTRDQPASGQRRPHRELGHEYGREE